MSQAMYALSIRQPWAWCILNAGKDIENRTESSAKRMRRAVGQRIAIHASKTTTTDAWEYAGSFLPTLGMEAPDKDDVPYGGFVGTVYVESLVSRSESRWYVPGCWGLALSSPSQCRFIPYKGQVTLFQVPDEMIVDV